MREPAYDVIVAGSGAAGLTAAAVAAAEGARVLLLERGPLLGGTTAISGGMVWIPANHKMAQAGIADSPERAREYLAHTLADGGEDDARCVEFLARGDEAIRYLEARTSLRLQPVRVYPDYYPDRPGATAGGRVLEAVPFDASVLGPWFRALRPPLPEFTLFGGMMVSREDIPHFRRAARSPASAWRVTTLLARYARQRLRTHRGSTLYLGNALAGRLLKSCVELGVEIRTGQRIARLVREAGRVRGVELDGAGDDRLVDATRGVILATGGISHDAALRAEYVPAAAGTLTATVGAGPERRGARLAREAGARLSAPVREGSKGLAFWVPGSTFTRADGTPAVYPHTVTDRAKPGLIAVDRRGERFVNEAVSYHDFVRAQLAAGERAIPAWLIGDRRFVWKYGLGRINPFTLSLGPHVGSGYLKRAQTLEGLAREIGVPADALRTSIAAFNDDARRGVDSRFGRGADIYQRHLGDSDRHPNPCVAPIETPPFHAVAVVPADLGMSAGIVTDPHGRVLADEGGVIEGLYACGNDMESFMGGEYPGPGINLGPALVFGYLAARHAARRPFPIHTDEGAAR